MPQPTKRLLSRLSPITTERDTLKTERDALKAEVDRLEKLTGKAAKPPAGGGGGDKKLTADEWLPDVWQGRFPATVRRSLLLCSADASGRRPYSCGFALNLKRVVETGPQNTSSLTLNTTA